MGDNDWWSLRGVGFGAPRRNENVLDRFFTGGKRVNEDGCRIYWVHWMVEWKRRKGKYRMEFGRRNLRC